MREVTKRYEKCEKATVTKLLESGFKQVKDLDGAPTATFSYTKELLDEIDIIVEIDIFEKFDDTRHVQVFDNYGGGLFNPFYDEERDYPFLNELIKEYNRAMDNLVNEGVLKPKKLEQTKKLINKRIEE
ncbi:MAG: hypothetical protein IKF37_00280 [Bacilli bacterium]|nr:hypothetical protein [Bacilli bacterium]